MTPIRHTLFVLAAASAAASAQPTGPWQQIWSEEFNSPAITDWEAQTGTGTAFDLPPGWGNEELQYYTNLNANIDVSGGSLKIIAREQSFGGRNYTSARLRTKDRFEFAYGRIEARMKLPSTTGIWPALWMLATDSPYGGWASSGEIDIMESVNQADRTYGTIHYGAPWPGNRANGNSFSIGVDLSEDFHIYTTEWDPDEIRWYLDGQLFHTVNSNVWFSSLGGDNPRAPFNVPFHLLVNVAVGGNFPGNPNGSSQFPQTLEVDYIRVSQRETVPFGGRQGIPGRVEAENYANGYPGVAYQDSSIGNNGAVFRQDDVDVQVCTEGGFNIGWIEPGEWVDLPVSVSQSGTYLIGARVASQVNGGRFVVQREDGISSDEITVTSTGGWQSWSTRTAEIDLETGDQTLRFLVDDASAGFNLNYLDFTLQSAGCSEFDLAEPFGTLNFFDLGAFLDLFGQQDSSADLAEPIGTWNFFDLGAFLEGFAQGCP